MLDLCLFDYLVIARAAQDFAPIMEFYEAWAEAEQEERQLIEDEELALGLQRALKRNRSCSPTSPAEPDRCAPLPAVPGEVEDRDSCTISCSFGSGVCFASRVLAFKLHFKQC